MNDSEHRWPQYECCHLQIRNFYFFFDETNDHKHWTDETTLATKLLDTINNIFAQRSPKIRFTRHVGFLPKMPIFMSLSVE